jgi:twitching motility protein PilT
MIAGSLRGIICERLVEKKDGGVALACELLVNNLAISNTILEGKLHLIMPILQTGTKSGMCSMDGSLFNLFKNGTITNKTALNSMANPRNYQKQIDAIKVGK